MGKSFSVLEDFVRESQNELECPGIAEHRI